MGNRDYAYDVGTNALLEIEPPLAALLRSLSHGDGPDPEDEFTPDQMRRARESLARARGEGLFSSHRPRIRAESGSESRDRNLQHLVLTVTEACNLRCRYCLHGAELGWVRTHGDRTMPPEIASRAVDYFLDRCDPDRAPVISFYGGEPLLAFPTITAAVSRIRAHRRGRDAVLAMDTNGMLLDRRAADLILQEALHLQVSLDGPPEIHDRHRRGANGRPSHAAIMAGLHALLAADASLASRLVFVVTLAPPFDLAAVAEYFAGFPLFRDLGIRRDPLLRVNFADLAGQDWPDQDRHFREASRQLESLRQRYLDLTLAGRRAEIGPVSRALFDADLVRFHRRSRRRLGPVISPGSPCALGRRKLHVGVDGRLQPCERTGEAFSLGNIETGIRPAKVQDHENGFRRGCEERCGDCWAVRLCGMCHAHLARAGVRSLADIPPRECGRERNRIQGIMGMMTSLLQGPEECRMFLDEFLLD